MLMLGRPHCTVLKEGCPKSEGFLGLCKLLVLLLLEFLSSEVFIRLLLVHCFLLSLNLGLDFVLHSLLNMRQLPVQVLCLPHKLSILVCSIII